MATEIQISALKDGLENEHQRWRSAQDNYERQVLCYICLWTLMLFPFMCQIPFAPDFPRVSILNFTCSMSFTVKYIV